MTETMLTILDQQMALSDGPQKPEGSLSSNLLVPGQVSSHGNIEESKTEPLPVAKVKSRHPDLYLPITENYKISNKFYGYMDSMSADGNPMILVELTALSNRYGTTIPCGGHSICHLAITSASTITKVAIPSATWQ